MATDRQNRFILEALQLSRRMHELAQAGSWERVEEMEQQRRDLLETCFSTLTSLPGKAWAAEQLREIIALDRQTMEMGARARDDAGAILARLNQGRQAANAYRKYSP